MAEKISPIDVELQTRVIEAMFEFSELGNGVTKCTIPDDIFQDDREVTVAGKEYGIYDIPGLELSNGSSKIIEHAIEKYIRSHGAPTWSQVVTEAVQDPSQLQMVSYPKTVYLRS